MNYLCHALLSPPEAGCLTGNVIADWVKGDMRRAVRGQVCTGIRMHRAVDRFVDGHPRFLEARRFVHPSRRRYAGVVVDVLFDACAAARWDSVSPLPRNAFTGHANRRLTEGAADVMPPLKCHLQRFIAADVLGNSGNPAAIERSFARLAKRSRFQNTLDSAADDWAGNEAALIACFLDVFADAQGALGQR